MNLESFLAKYKDLLFLPLDLTMPVLDEVAFAQWVVENVSESNAVAERISGRSGSEATDGFWMMSYFFRDGKWLTGFAERFPEWVAFFESVPLLNKATFYVLRQPVDQDLTWYLHFDEPVVPGFRAYVNADDGLFFRRLKDSNSLPSMSELNDYRTMEHKEELLKAGRLHVQPPCSSFPFLLCNQQAPHAIRVQEGSHRKLTFVIQSGNQPNEVYDWPAYMELIERSLLKYSTSAIWLHDTRWG